MSLMRGQDPKGRGGDRRIEFEHLPRGNERVPTEQGRVSRRAGSEIAGRSPQAIQVVPQAGPNPREGPSDRRHRMANPEDRAKRGTRARGEPTIPFVPASPPETAPTEA